MTSSKLNKTNSSALKSLSKRFNTISKNSADFLSIHKPRSDGIRKILQQTYDVTALNDAAKEKSLNFLPQLVVDELDWEQIWQLIELRNSTVCPQLIKKTSKLLSLKEHKIQINYEQRKTNDKDPEESLDSNLSDSGELESQDDEACANSFEGKIETEKKFSKREKPSIVDDQFFKLSEMEAFLKAEEDKFMNSKSSNIDSENHINYFDENLDDEEDEEENIQYKDFFDEDIEDQKEQQSFDENDDTDNENTSIPPTEKESDKQNKNAYEDRQERLNQRIREYEQDILGEKPWQLKGEVEATNRPQNSLLEEILEFEPTSRPPLKVTEETTLRLEDIIRQRIKGELWDNVEYKVKQINTTHEYRKQFILDQEKSKESLAHIYEKQYQQEIQKTDPSAENAKEEPKSHKEINDLMCSLFVKLDALSNFHFTPKPVAPELKVLTNIPAVNMEEVATTVTSQANLLAPEEIRKRSRGDVLGKTERQKVDKNREKRHRKQKLKGNLTKIRDNGILGQKNDSKFNKKGKTDSMNKLLARQRNVKQVVASDDAGAMKSSKAFFSKLQETTSKQKHFKEKKTRQLPANKLKL